MSLQDVRECLFETNLNFDPSMANEVTLFFTQNHITVDNYNIYLQTVAAAAIISQAKSVMSKQPQGSTQQHVTFEISMTRLNGYSKGQFIRALQAMISKNSNLQQKLSSKIKNLELSYRLFKKYHKTFVELWQHTEINSFVMNDLLSIFWITYLLFKNAKNQIFQNIPNQIELLIILIKSIFQNWVSCVPEGVVQAEIQRNFNDKVSKLFDVKLFFKYLLEMKNFASQLYSLRYKQELEFKIFSKNPIKIAKFLDDIANYFYQQNYPLQTDNYIDEISYLGLRQLALTADRNLMRKDIKNLQENKAAQIKLGVQNIPPENEFKSQDKKKQNHSQPTIPVLKQANHFIIAENIPQMTPFRDRRGPGMITPCHNRIENLNWIRTSLDLMQSSTDTNQHFNRVFNFVQKQSLIDFEFKARKQLFFLVEEFTPKCKRRQQRVNDMFSFFKYIIISISRSHDNSQNAQMFKQIKTFNAIMVLSCDIFNFAYNSIMSSYRRVCQIFEVPLIEALKPINWIGKNIKKPNELDAYLYALEKRIVIKEIWQDQTGYNLLKSQQVFNQSSSIGYNDMVVWNRLIKHIFDRVTELSREVKLQHKQNKRIQNLIETILKSKPFLLHKNKIDQIIICCMTSFLTINQIHQQKTLEKVFNDYNRIDLSVNQNRQGLSGDGRQMTLAEFYNQVFLPQIQDIVDNNSAQNDFLQTPIRKSYHQRASNNGGLTTPFTKKYPENQIDSLLNSDSTKLVNAQGFKMDGCSFLKSKLPHLTPQAYRAKLIAEQQKIGKQMEPSKIQSENMSERSDESDGSKEQKQIENSRSDESEKLDKSQNSESKSSENQGEEEKNRENMQMIKEEEEAINSGARE